MNTSNRKDFDVLIVGAGISGIGAACHLSRECPEKSFLIFEGRDDIGGTWDLFRYPGIRSDSDMLTLGYRFKPWNDPKIIADGPSIKQYLHETVDEYGLQSRIRFGHRVTAADWSSEEARWTVTVTTPLGQSEQYTCRFFYSCTGYYDYREGYTPVFPGREDFRGTIIHPQHWPEDLDYSGKRVVVIGSGATAITLVPAMTDKAAHVTMLQRSPSYVVSIPAVDKLSQTLSRILPDMSVFRLGRLRNVSLQLALYKACRRFPKLMRRLLLAQMKAQLGDKVDIKHFSPRYNPWDERLCVVPNGDLFKALRNGEASVVTDHIDRFVEDGILLKSGEKLAADIIITATGLEVLFLGGMQLSVDGEAFDPTQAFAYKAIMLSNLPNFAYTVGYTNASWTLKADLAAEYVCRLLKHMDRKGVEIAVPQLPDGKLPETPLLDLQSGYVQRAADRTPKQSDRAPWKLHQNYALDLPSLRYAPIEDGVMTFAKAGSRLASAAARRAAA